MGDALKEYGAANAQPISEKPVPVGPGVAIADADGAPIDLFTFKHTLPPDQVDDDLTRKFPRAWRHIVRDDFWWIVLCVAAGGALSMLDLLVSAQAEPSPLALALERVLVVLLVASVSLLVGKLLHSFLRHIFRVYKIRKDRLYLSEGVLIRKEKIAFLDKMIDVTVGKTWSDVIFYLCYVDLIIIGEPDVRITGFSPPVAKEFQRYLVQLIERKNASAGIVPRPMGPRIGLQAEPPG